MNWHQRYCRSHSHDVQQVYGERALTRSKVFAWTGNFKVKEKMLQMTKNSGVWQLQEIIQIWEKWIKWLINKWLTDLLFGGYRNNEHEGDYGIHVAWKFAIGRKPRWKLYRKSQQHANNKWEEIFSSFRNILAEDDFWTK